MSIELIPFSIIDYQVLLFNWYIFVYILASHKCIEEKICKAGDEEPVALDCSYVVCKQVLEERNDTAAANESHKDSGRSRSVFSKTLGREVED